MHAPVRVMCLAGLIGCGEDVVSAPGETVATSAAASSASAVPKETATASANATPRQRASATSNPSSWLGPIPSEGRATLGNISRYEQDGRFKTAIAIPEGWSTLRLDEGRGDGVARDGAGILARPADKSALVIVIEHGAIHESLVEFGAGRWLGISGGATDLSWGEIEPAPAAGEGFSLRHGQGKLWGARAELIQLRLRVPSAEKGPETLFLLGAVKSSAPRERRAEYLACLASYTASGP